MGLRFVHLEDDPNDRELVAATLCGEQVECSVVPVATRAAFECALGQGADLILADNSLPEFDGLTAQQIARERCPDVPFIFVTGSIGEEEAVERLRNGATDYVLKHHLDKLPSAVRRAIREADDRRQRAVAEAELRRLNQELEGRVAERTRALTEANAALQEARAEADRANHAKSDFLSRMSHDLRTPLNAIMGFAQVLQLDPLDPEQSDSVTQILRGGEHLLNLINEVLDIARIEAGHLTLSPEPVELHEIITHAVDFIQPLAAQRDIRVTVEAPASLTVLADRQRLNQILLNLLSNAVKYNRRGGTVLIGAAGSAATARLSVTDSGAGIPPAKLALLFQPFERLGAEQSGVEGTGLGLALSKRLAEAMNGRLTVSSVVDHGTTFHVDLPAGDALPREAPTAPERPAAALDVHGIVLYIEDNAANAQLMRRVIARRPGVALQHATDGRTGLQMLSASPPDLIILDLHLFDMSGEEVLRQVWENPATRSIPVAVLSADATPGSRRRLLASGAFRYLTKPFEIAAVLQVVDDVLGESR